ncbi:hypothetical protein K461DRAFT_166810 [Myriangium duriaei CBS 260.36]|uniref:Uncharacterized protein n=1 Tax=Myriangium duriaei CBS 260.36 TaxID=1168546 RepID=A0A9P4IW96_9PEZI|nr:hypothetical protein K461DRAFT_166810 [Myriangium duriaei CBS 260.36]
MSTADPEPQQRSKPGILPNLPNISTTISSILQTSTSAPTLAQSNAPSVTPPATLASYLPASVSAAPMTAWFKKPATKSAIKSTNMDSRDSSPSKSVMFSSSARGVDSTEIDRQSQDTNSDRGRRSKRCSKPKSCYSICYAPPRSGNRHKIQVRARPLLQLHKLEARSRPRPEFELLNSAIFSSRLNKAIARFSPSKHGISPTDLAIVRAEKYHEHEASLVEEDETRDILAIISGLSKSGHAAKLHLERGVEWEAYRLPNGGYECVTTDAHGLKRTVRWVPKKNTKAELADESSSTKKFKFSTITPGTRRHPVIANLAGTGLDINDVYTLPTPTSNPNSRAASPMQRQDSDMSIDTSEQMMTTTDDLRNIITSTAIFVALCEGWCPGYRSEDILSRSPSLKSVASSKSPNNPHKRNMSFGDNESLRRNGSMRQALRSPSFFRTGSFKHDSRPSSSSSSVALDNMSIPPIPEQDAAAPVTEQSDPPRRARADTVSTVIVRDSGSQWRPTYDDETEDEAEPEEEDHDIKSEKDSEIGDKRRHSGMTLLDGPAETRSRANTIGSTTIPEKRTVSSSTTRSDNSGPSMRKEKEKKFSTASTIVADEPSGRKKVSEKQPKKKSTLLRILFCGMV